MLAAGAAMPAGEGTPTLMPGEPGWGLVAGEGTPALKAGEPG